MWRTCCRIVLIALVLSTLFVTPTLGTGSTEEPAIVAVSPNPVSDMNDGEFVVLDPNGPLNLAGWSLADGNHAVDLPDVTITEPVALTGSPSVTELLVDKPVLGWEGHLRLAAEGDTVWLRDPTGRVVDEFTYPRTPLDQSWRRNGELERVPAEYESLVFPAHREVHATAFVLPDSPEVPREMLSNATERLWIAGYEISDPEIEAILAERHAAGVDVRVLIDGRPVGGQSAAEVETLDRLDRAGVPIRVMTGSRDRFRFHHPKYAVVDDSAVVMTENWKRAGTGAASSRGWGIALYDPTPVEDLATVFEIDYTARDTVSWTRRRLVVTGRPTDVSTGTFPTTFTPESASVDRLHILLTPTNAEAELAAEIRGAEERIDVQQVRISDPNFPLLGELISAAERGVRVRILLDSTWYVRSENEFMAGELNAFASDEDLPLEVRLVEPADRFGKIHTKGMIIDGETTVVGSMNWNNVSMRENREVVVIVESATIAEFFTATFDHDWEAPGVIVPAGVILATVTTWVVVGLFARRFVSFDPVD